MWHLVSVVASWSLSWGLSGKLGKLLTIRLCSCTCSFVHCSQLLLMSQHFLPVDSNSFKPNTTNDNIYTHTILTWSILIWKSNDQTSCFVESKVRMLLESRRQTLHMKLHFPLFIVPWVLSSTGSLLWHCAIVLTRLVFHFNEFLSQNFR